MSEINPLRIGSVVRVQSGRVEVMIDVTQFDIEHKGRHFRVGQLGSYVAVPVKDCTLIGFVTEASRRPAPDSNSTELILIVELLGEMHGERFHRGVNESPIVGDEVRLAVQSDFERIFGSFDEAMTEGGVRKSFTLGKFAMDTDFQVKVLGSEFFNKHSAILGNSGAGKSCTTAKVLHEVLELPEAQVIMFDMHGEYRAAFSDEDGNTLANVTYMGSEDLVLPYWLLRYEELETLLVDRSNPEEMAGQISFLRTALLEFKRDAAKELGLSRELTLDTPIYFSLDKLRTYAANLNEARFVLNSDSLAFQKLALRSLPPDEQQALMRKQRCEFNKGNPQGEVPHPLYFGKLIGLIDQIDTRLEDRRYEFLLRPINHAKQTPYFRDQLTDTNTAGQMSQVLLHLIELLTGRVTPRSNLTIIDLSGIPFDVVDIAVAVVTRLMFELNFWTPPSIRHPTLLVYEEAHNYIPRNPNVHSFARSAVERVAKEGRKYGVAATVVSQRPAELSETVLAQCNSLIVMRLNNPDDQQYVARVVSDHFANLIKSLPLLRPGEGFIIGDAVLMPLRTLVDPPKRFPRSGNVDFFGVWSKGSAESDIERIVAHWWRQDRQGVNEEEDGQLVPGLSKPKAAAVPTGEKELPFLLRNPALSGV